MFIFSHSSLNSSGLCYHHSTKTALKITTDHPVAKSSGRFSALSVLLDSSEVFVTCNTLPPGYTVFCGFQDATLSGFPLPHLLLPLGFLCWFFPDRFVLECSGTQSGESPLASVSSPSLSDLTQAVTLNIFRSWYPAYLQLRPCFCSPGSYVCRPLERQALSCSPCMFSCKTVGTTDGLLLYLLVGGCHLCAFCEDGSATWEFFCLF